MKRTAKWLPLVLLLAAAGTLPGLSQSVDARAEQADPIPLQRLVDAAGPGETIELGPGLYEGPVTIGKPIAIRADRNARLTNGSGEPAIRIEADGVRLEGLRIANESAADAAAVLVAADDAVLRELHITTRSYGIKVEHANRARIEGASIEWGGAPTAKVTERRNGIDLYESHDGLLADNAVSDMHDGIYLESSTGNVIERNRIDRSRYGIHCMYADRTVIRNNTGAFNVTGAMVMGVKDGEVAGNTFFKQSENVHSQGFLLFDVHSSRLYDNRAEGNRVGFYVERSGGNALYRNEISQNFVGIQFIEAEGNELYDNVFVGNVVEAEARSSPNNRLTGNYWDSFRGIDADGDGRSDTAHAINPFFQTLSKSRPAYQLFFQSPGMIFLESMFQAGRSSWTTDTAPLMKPVREERSPEGRSSTLLSGLGGAALLAAAIALMTKMGVRRA